MREFYNQMIKTEDRLTYKQRKLRYNLLQAEIKMLIEYRKGLKEEDNRGLVNRRILEINKEQYRLRFYD